MDTQIHVDPKIKKVFWFALGYYIGSHYQLERPVLVRKDGK